MENMTPILDTRSSDEIYKQALKLAEHYCPEWAKGWEDDHFDPEDPGLVIFKLFSKMAEYSIKQFNRVPEKHCIVFFDFMGIDVRSARPSVAPLTFYLAEGSQIARIPSGTLVASSKYPDIVFETSKHLTAIALELYGLSINPADDSYTDHSGKLSGEETFSIFSNEEEKPFEHILYLGDDDIFGGKTPSGELTIKFRGSNLSLEFFKQWFNGQGMPVDVEIKTEKDNGLLVFNIKNFNAFESTIFNDARNFWLFTKPDKGIKIVKGKLPEILLITVDFRSGSIIPEFIFFENMPVDLKKGFYPFGETPKIGNSLYICSGEALSKENSIISINVEFEKELDDKSIELLWEFWDGSSWKSLQITKDDTDGFRKSGICVIEFVCPYIPEEVINVEKGRWIRVAIKSGGYGSPGKFEQNRLDEVIDLLPGSFDRIAVKKEFEKKGISFGIQYVPPAYDPPFIKSIDLVYTFKDRKIEQVLSYNNFLYKDFSESDNIIPFEPFGADRPVFYLGFEKIKANIPLSLYFSIKEKLSENSTLKWKYYDGSAWKDLSIENDETDSFNKSGIVSFLFPSEIKKSFEFGRELFWIRIESGNRQSYTEINGIFPNTVWAANGISVNNEVLGSGNGLPGQSFSFSRRSVLPGQKIEVREADTPVEWMETGSFSLSGKLSRDYMIDRKEGKIIFGDGINGMVPPKGKNNIIARSYRSGGGKKGNREKGIINTLRKSNPFVEKVTNHESASGGADEEDIEGAVFRGPHTIKNGGYAVTVEDFEWLAREASPEVIRSKAFLDHENRIYVIILADRKSDTLLPEKNLMDSVEKYIRDRAFFNIRENIHVLRPEYIRIDSEVTVKPLLINESSIVMENVKNRLRTFLDPVSGGKYGTGYDFGERIYVSDIACVIEDTEGVDYVGDINVKKIIDDMIEDISGSGWISFEDNALPYSGNIEVKIIQ
ncbi:MAG: putative baseplate assembly protein [Candidatus Methanoperedenaceae archaeon]|nr:MAG: putative baseplate assembly protein [Candidatus Methanoperedenaceae archaeon]